MKRGIVARVVWRVMITNAIGALLSVFTPIADPSTHSTRFHNLYVVVFFVFLVGVFSVNVVLVSRRVRRALGSIDIANLPRYCTLVTMISWLVGGGVACVLEVFDGTPTINVIAVALRNIIGGLSAGAIVYLLIERAIGPYYANAFGPVDPRRGGLRYRLVLAWLAGSALPVIMFGSVLFGRTAAARGEITGYGWLYIGTALIAGIGMTLAIAGSVAAPVETLRGAMARVESGDLDQHVLVDDGTEIGALQNGFNRMVDGLRERQRLHDLFGRHVGEEVARLALDREPQLGGEQVLASALFVDLTGSTAMGESLPPHEVVGILNEFFRVVLDAVTPEGGWVNKFEGDAALCVFGPPVGHDDHAARALRAAVAMRRGLRVFSAEHDGLDAGIGVASGPVVAGNVGAAERYEYTVIGDPVNSAARVTDLAKQVDGRVLVTGWAWEQAGCPDGWSEVDEVVLRGRSAATRLYAPVGRQLERDERSSPSTRLMPPAG